MGVIIDAVLDKIFGKVGGGNQSISTVDKVTASKKSELEAIKAAGDTQLVTATIASKRKFQPTVTSVPGKEGVQSPTSISQFAVSANLSGGIKGGLTQDQIDEIRKRPFTTQELKDIENLRIRRNKSKGTAKFDLKDDPEEVIFKKREQEAIAKGVIGQEKFLDGKLFAKPGFAGFIKTGQGKLTQGQKQRLQQIRKNIDPKNFSQAEIEEVQRNIIKNKQVAARRDREGAAIQEELNRKGITQSEAVLSKGAVLRGGNTLNARALAKLREQGLI